MRNLEKTYDPKSFEDRIYQSWKESGSFHTKIDPDKKPYTISMPPPNVTGALHMGHALGSTMQDILIRYKRMQGYAALWVPGTDHASISTEAKVVEKITAENKSKEELGREGFLEEAWAWTEKYGGKIVHQLERLGVSCDWERQRFTLDEGLSHAVEEQFIRLYNDGYIYRGDRIINYCINCGTAISDAEVEHEDTHGHLWTIRYPFSEDSDAGIEIATTRPETMLGDLAIAVHPDDERYKEMVGETVILPLVGRRIPIIADEYVDPSFGSGAVKITPSHDPNDFVVGERHGLGQCVILTNSGHIAEGYAYSGMTREDARIQMVKDLSEQGYLVEIKDHDHAVGHCERCNTVIEPLISKQWFVAMKELAKEAMEVYHDGRLRIVPDRFGKVYLSWLENIRDWCISRQLWWGHRLPVYYCDHCGEVIVDRKMPHACPSCGNHAFTRDEDTLDTWFSSALWPYSTLGWPEKTDDLAYFFPTDVLVTGYDIIFFWVIRMVFSSLYSMGEVPFRDVYLTGIIRDAQGRKMSKSLNNGIDPLEIIDQYGADALRFMLVTGNSPGNDMRFHIEKVEQARNFANKLWNASRFVLMYAEEGKEYALDESRLATEDRWILSLLNETIEDMDRNMDKYEIGMAAQRVYDFTWNNFCDWYIELVKPRLYEAGEEKDRTMGVLLTVLQEILKRLHPFIPFITEEIYAYLPSTQGQLMDQLYGEAPKIHDSSSIRQMDLVMESVIAIRNLRQEKGIAPQRKSELIFVSEDQEIRESLMNNAHHLLKLGFGTQVEVLEKEDERVNQCLPIVLSQMKVFLPMTDLLDIEKETARLQAEITKLNGEVQRIEGKLQNEGFVKKAPAAVVEAEREKLTGYKKQMEETKNSLANLQELAR